MRGVHTHTCLHTFTCVCRPEYLVHTRTHVCTRRPEYVVNTQVHTCTRGCRHEGPIHTCTHVHTQIHTCARTGTSIPYTCTRVSVGPRPAASLSPSPPAVVLWILFNSSPREAGLPVLLQDGGYEAEVDGTVRDGHVSAASRSVGPGESQGEFVQDPRRQGFQMPRNRDRLCHSETPGAPQ